MLFYSIGTLPNNGNGLCVSVDVTREGCSLSNSPLSALASSFTYTAKRPLLVMTSCAWGCRLVV